MNCGNCKTSTRTTACKQGIRLISQVDIYEKNISSHKTKLKYIQPERDITLSKVTNNTKFLEDEETQVITYSFI